MKAGLFQLFETLGEIPVGEAYRLAVEEAVLGEELGFDAVCPAEHHFAEHYGIMPQTEMYLSWVAARTRRLRLWPMVIVAPLHDPVRLAERIAMLDQFSGGRVVFSVGSGYRGYEFDGFGLRIRDNAARLRECVEVCRRAWSGAPVGFAGEHYRVDGVAVFPTPAQRPHPPIYLTTTRDDQVQWAAREGFGVVPAAGFSPHELRHVFDLHGRAATAAGRTPPPERPFFKWIYVDEDDRRAREVAQTYFMKTVLAFAHGGGHLLQVLSDKIRATWPADKPLDRYDAADFSFERLTDPAHTPLAYGDPARVRDMLAPCVAAGADYFVGGFAMGVMPADQVRRSMKLFSDKVLPLL